MNIRSTAHRNHAELKQFRLAVAQDNTRSKMDVLDGLAADEAAMTSYCLATSKPLPWPQPQCFLALVLSSPSGSLRAPPNPAQDRTSLEGSQF